MDTNDKEKEEKEKIEEEWRKQIQEEQMRLHPEIYDKKLNNEIDK